jgi:hypothetical protein
MKAQHNVGIKFVFFGLPEHKISRQHIKSHQAYTVNVPEVFTTQDIGTALAKIDASIIPNHLIYRWSAGPMQSTPPPKMPFLASQLPYSDAMNFHCIERQNQDEVKRFTDTLKSQFTREDYKKFGIECTDAQWTQLKAQCKENADGSISAPELSKCRSALVKALSYGLPLCAILAACVAYFLSNQENTGRAK